MRNHNDKGHFTVRVIQIIEKKNLKYALIRKIEKCLRKLIYSVEWKTYRTQTRLLEAALYNNDEVSHPIFQGHL